MKITVTFDTSDPDERLEHLQCMAALPALGALYDLSTLLGRMRYDVGESDHDQQTKEILDLHLNQVVTAYNDILDKHGIDLERLYP